MADQYCSEVFLAGQNEVVNQKHMDYILNEALSVQSSLNHRGSEFDFADTDSSSSFSYNV